MPNFGKAKDKLAIWRANRQAKRRRKEMLKQGLITQEQYDAAIEAKIQKHSDY